MSKWISVKDKLPGREVYVLVYVPSTDEIAVASFCNWEICNQWHLVNNNYDPNEYNFKDVTHWMELPKAPQDK